MCLSAGNAGAPCWDLYRRRPACPGRGVFDDGVVHLLYSSAAVPREIEIGDTPGLDGCRFSDSIEEGPTVKAAARCLVRSRLVATEPQWPRMNSTISRSMRTRHSRVIFKIGLRALRLLRIRPSSLPRFAASDDGHFAPGEPPARPKGLSCDSHGRCLPPSLPMRQGCRFRQRPAIYSVNRSFALAAQR